MYSVAVPIGIYRYTSVFIGMHRYEYVSIYSVACLPSPCIHRGLLGRLPSIAIHRYASVGASSSIHFYPLLTSSIFFYLLLSTFPSTLIYFSTCTCVLHIQGETETAHQRTSVKEREMERETERERARASERDRETSDSPAGNRGEGNDGLALEGVAVRDEVRLV